MRVLRPPLFSLRLAEAMPAFGAALAPVVERIARMLASASPYDVETPSVLTREKHRAAARRRVDGASPTTTSAKVGPGTEGLAPRSKRRQKPPAQLKRLYRSLSARGAASYWHPSQTASANVGPTARTVSLAVGQRLGAGLPKSSRDHAAGFISRGGPSPTHNPEVRERRRAANTAKQAEQAAWDRDQLGDEPDENGSDQKFFLA